MEKETRKPVKAFRCGCIQMAIWLHPTELDGKIVDIPSLRISKSYRDNGTGDWIKTEFLRPDDLPKVITVAGAAYNFLRLKSVDPKVQCEPSDLLQGTQ